MKAIALLFITVGLCRGYVTSSRPGLFFPRENSKQCQGPNGAGLESTFAELDKFIPLDKVLEIALTAMTSDQEVQNVMTYLTSPETLTRIQRVFKMDEVRKLIGFACKELYFDAVYYVNQIAFILGLPPLEHNSMRMPRNVINLRQGGVRGLIADVVRVVDVKNMKAYMQDKLNNDKYVQLAYKAFHSPEGRECMEKVVTSEDIQKLTEDIMKLIADFAAVIEDIRKLLGWTEI